MRRAFPLYPAVVGLLLVSPTAAPDERIDALTERMRATADHYLREARKAQENPDVSRWTPGQLTGQLFRNADRLPPGWRRRQSIELADGFGRRRIHIATHGREERLLVLSLQKANQWIVTADQAI